MAKYIFSNILGTFLFDENFKVIEKIPYKGDEDRDYTKELPAETKLKNKYKDALKPDYAKETKVLQKILDHFSQNPKLFYQPNLSLTARKLTSSVSDDNIIIHTISSIEELDKAINMLSKRLREWFDLYLPEFNRSTPDHEAFVQLILRKNRKEMMKDLNINSTLGKDFDKIDMKPMMDLAGQIDSLFKLRKKQELYLEIMMKRHCPNLNELAGTLIGAKLFAIAGSLRKLALFPASTVQLLGAENALFRHMRTGAKPPKYGVIISHPIVRQAKEKGKAARALADKLSLAVKIDLYKGQFIADKYKKDLEEKFR